jgi:hypothetical protein
MLTTTKKKKKVSIYSSRLKLHDSSVAFIKSIPPSLSLSLSLSQTNIKEQQRPCLAIDAKHLKSSHQGYSPAMSP